MSRLGLGFFYHLLLVDSPLLTASATSLPDVLICYLYISPKIPSRAFALPVISSSCLHSVATLLRISQEIHSSLRFLTRHNPLPVKSALFPSSLRILFVALNKLPNPKPSHSQLPVSHSQSPKIPTQNQKIPSESTFRPPIRSFPVSPSFYSQTRINSQRRIRPLLIKQGFRSQRLLNGIGN